MREVGAVAEIIAVKADPNRGDQAVQGPTENVVQLLADQQARLGVAANGLQALDPHAHIEIPGNYLIAEPAGVIAVTKAKPEAHNCSINRSGAHGSPLARRPACARILILPELKRVVWNNPRDAKRWRQVGFQDGNGNGVGDKQPWRAVVPDDDLDPVGTRALGIRRPPGQHAIGRIQVHARGRPCTQREGE
jgi:hypothetical protein